MVEKLKSYHRDNCRLCKSNKLELALPMKPTPIGDAFVKNGQSGEPQELYPLDLYLCMDCSHIQLLDIIDPSLLFGEYSYHSASSKSLIDHFQKYADELITRFKPAAGSLIIDIGSNDGSFLRFFKEKGFKVLGIDPAKQIAKEASDGGIPTIGNFFDSSLAKTIRNEQGTAAVVIANNVFAHIDNIIDVADGIKHLLSSDGIFVFEVSYLIDTIERLLFDTIYHEHLSYHSIRPLIGFLERSGLELFDVQRIGSKGGSIRCFAQQKDGAHKRSKMIDELLMLESRMEITKPAIFRQFSDRINNVKTELHKTLGEKAKHIAGFGASVTVTTLIYQYELGDKIKFIVDDNRSKEGLYSPGYHIPVHHSSALYEKRPDHTVILAWQYADPIIKNHSRYVDEGGRFVVPSVPVKTVP